jgi:hypothetical protein
MGECPCSDRVLRIKAKLYISALETGTMLLAESVAESAAKTVAQCNHGTLWHQGIAMFKLLFPFKLLSNVTACQRRRPAREIGEPKRSYGLV